MRHTAQALMLALVLGPAAATAQAPAAESNPAARLLSHREELSLDADQVKRLEAIDRHTAQQDAELRVKVEALRGKPLGEPLLMRQMTLEQRQAMQAKRAELLPLMEQLRTIHAQAAADARAVLTPEQNARAGEFLFVGPGQGQGRGPAAGGGQWRRQGQGRGAGWARMGRGGWQNQAGAPGRWRGGRGW